MSSAPRDPRTRTGSLSPWSHPRSTTVPMVSGGGTAATKPPNWCSGTAHSSTSIPLAGKAGIAQQTRLRWHGAGQRKQSIVRRGSARAHESRAALGQLMVERLTAEMGSHHPHQHAAGSRVCERHAAPSTNRSASGQQRLIGEGRADERHAERQPIGPEAGGHGHRGQIHQVDEVRVEPEVGVQPRWDRPRSSASV